MRARLIHPTLDVWLLGGIPLLAIMLALLIPGSMRDPLLLYHPIALFFFSYPHFMASYYGFYRQQDVWKKHWFAVLLNLSQDGGKSLFLRCVTKEPGGIIAGAVERVSGRHEGVEGDPVYQLRH